LEARRKEEEEEGGIMSGLRMSARSIGMDVKEAGRESSGEGAKISILESGSEKEEGGEGEGKEERKGEKMAVRDTSRREPNDSAAGFTSSAVSFNGASSSDDDGGAGVVAGVHEPRPSAGPSQTSILVLHPL